MRERGGKKEERMREKEREELQFAFVRFFCPLCGRRRGKKSFAARETTEGKEKHS